MILTMLCLFLTISSFASDDLEAATDTHPGQSAKSAENASELTAEETLRAFLVAMVRNDAAKIKQLTRPTDEIEWLLKSRTPPAVAEQLEKQLTRIPIRTLKAGESVKRIDGRVETVAPDEVAPDRVVMMISQNSVFYYLKKIDGKWYVDPTRMIARIKSNDAFLKKQEALKNNPG